MRSSLEAVERLLNVVEVQEAIMNVDPWLLAALVNKTKDIAKELRKVTNEKSYHQ